MPAKYLEVYKNVNTFKTTVLLAALTGLLIAAGSFFGGARGMTVMFVVSMLMNFFSYWYSDKIVLKMYGATEVDMQTAPGLVGMVANLARKDNLPMPRVYIIDTDAPNAFATGRDPEHAAVAVTTSLMRGLTEAELEGVMAHELSHIKNRDTLISTMVSSLAGADEKTTELINTVIQLLFLGQTKNLKFHLKHSEINFNRVKKKNGD